MSQTQKGTTLDPILSQNTLQTAKSTQSHLTLQSDSVLILAELKLSSLPHFKNFAMKRHNGFPETPADPERDDVARINPTAKATRRGKRPRFPPRIRTSSFIIFRLFFN